MNGGAEAARVLVVDDDAEMRDALGTFLSSQGHQCELAADAVSALGFVERSNLDAIICDVRMEGMSGLELLDRVKRTHPSLPVVVVTGWGRINDAVSAIKRGAFHYMTKPCDFVELRETVACAIDEGRRHQDNDAVRSSRPVQATSFEILGDGPSMRLLQSSIDSVAASSAPVIVTGETGVGKELVARAIHARGARRKKPFVAVNTSAIPKDLLEAEVFGHVRGGFTGAIQSRKGLLTEADGGTLLLDEIGDMPTTLQAKLLRVLQFGEVRPIGSDRPHHVDVRVIAATHRNLPALVHEGRFREDLYFRLNVLPVAVPPLRARREDIPTLAAHFLAEACRRAPQSPVRSIDPDALRVLTESFWPGNVRELASVIERAVVFGTDERITPRDLVDIPTGSGATTAPSFPSQARWSLRDLNRAYTDWILVQTGGNKDRAAEILGIDLSTLYRRQRARQD
jgi:two-component system, NtrC family, response regulator HydG